jgi:N utilization substance protein B
MEKVPMQQRQRARRRALQALYQWQIKGEADLAETLVEQFLAHQDFAQVDQAYFEALVHGVVKDSERFDQQLQPFMDRPMPEVDQMERVILRQAAFELLEIEDLPYKVILDEAIELSHRFGAEQGHAFINAVLDKAARAWRPEEVSGG